MKMSRGPDGRPFAFADLPAEAFPVKVTCLEADGTVAWEATIEPYVATAIPAAPPEKEGTRTIHIEYGDGTNKTYGAMTADAARAYIEKRIEESKDAAQ